AGIAVGAPSSGRVRFHGLLVPRPCRPIHPATPNSYSCHHADRRDAAVAALGLRSLRLQPAQPDNRSGERREALSSKEDDATVSQQSHERSSASTPRQSECSGKGEGSWTELVERQAKEKSVKIALNLLSPSSRRMLVLIFSRL